MLERSFVQSANQSSLGRASVLVFATTTLRHYGVTACLSERAVVDRRPDRRLAAGGWRLACGAFAMYK